MALLIFRHPLLKIVSNFRRRSSCIYAIYGNRISMRMECWILTSKNSAKLYIAILLSCQILEEIQYFQSTMHPWEFNWQNMHDYTIHYGCDHMWKWNVNIVILKAPEQWSGGNVTNRTYEENIISILKRVIFW